MAFDLDPSYKQVPERIADFKAKHPEGSLRAADPRNPYRLEVIEGRTFIVYVAEAWRTPDDPAPGVGVAWEPVPGKTPYTRDSELQNAETSAWGRAIVAALASESKAIASAEDVRNRRAEQAVTEDTARFEKLKARKDALPADEKATLGEWWSAQRPRRPFTDDFLDEYEAQIDRLEPAE